MTEILFYHLQGVGPESVLPTLLSRTLERGWRAIVQVGSPERAEALDAHLWTFSDDSFLPHGIDKERDAASQPILLTAGDGNLNGGQVRFLTDNAPLPSDVEAYARVVLLFDGEDSDALDHARAAWSEAKGGGHAVTYWQQDENGRWQQHG